MGLSYSNLIKKLQIYLSSDWQHLLKSLSRTLDTNAQKGQAEFLCGIGL